MGRTAKGTKLWQTGPKQSAQADAQLKSSSTGFLTPHNPTVAGRGGRVMTKALQEGSFALPSHLGSIPARDQGLSLCSLMEAATPNHHRTALPGLRCILGALDFISIAAWMFAGVTAMPDSFMGGSSEELSVDAAAAAGLRMRILHSSIHNWLCCGMEGCKAHCWGWGWEEDTRVWMCQRDLVHLPREHLHPGQGKGGCCTSSQVCADKTTPQTAPVLPTQIMVCSHKIGFHPCSLRLSSCLLACPFPIYPTGSTGKHAFSGMAMPVCIWVSWHSSSLLSFCHSNGLRFNNKALL